MIHDIKKHQRALNWIPGETHSPEDGPGNQFKLTWSWLTDAASMEQVLVVVVSSWYGAE